MRFCRLRGQRPALLFQGTPRLHLGTELIFICVFKSSSTPDRSAKNVRRLRTGRAALLPGVRHCARTDHAYASRLNQTTQKSYVDFSVDLALA